jgi:hypothetical protein
MAQPVAVAPPTQIAFTLPRAANTSAGVYNDRQQLVRTLWRGDALPAGEHQRRWDGRDDQGTAVAAGDYDIKLIHHQLSYVWEGVVGNSSPVWGGPTVHNALLPPSSIAISGDRAYYAVDYNEQQDGLRGFLLKTPQIDTRPFASNNTFASYSMLAADATRLYWANTGGMSLKTFVAAYDIATAGEAVFDTGQSICMNHRTDGSCYQHQAHASIIDAHNEPIDAPTGLAVQRNGRVLAVAHGGAQVIRLFDKTSGVLLRDWPMRLNPNPKALNQLAMSASGDLWVVSGNTVLRYTNIDRAPKLAATVTGVTTPIALGSSATDDDALWVAEGGSTQQIKRFDRNGRPGPVIGRLGGYTHDPAVAPDKLCFTAREGRERTAVGVEPNGSVWVVDHCNNRMLHFRSTGAQTMAANADNQIAYLPLVYKSTVDHHNTRRVFANFLEFDVDNTQPLVAGKSWKLVRNWLAGLPTSLVDEHAFNGWYGGLSAVETLSNGRTYGMVQGQSRWAVVELPATGPLRIVKYFGKPMPGASDKVLYENGDLGYSLTGPTTQSVFRLPLTGFDASGEPLWATEPVKLASVPTTRGTPYFRCCGFSGMPARFPLTASNRVVFFDIRTEGNEGFHLGAAAAGGTDWLWQASPSGPVDGKGSFQTKAVDGSVNYGGNTVWTHGRHIVYGYHGEFYKDLKNGRVGQANQFMHFDESGLFIGQFGQPSTRPADAQKTGLSGNAFSPTLVRDGAKLYLYHNDESTHGGVHRWRLDGWNDVRELNGRGALGGRIELR